MLPISILTATYNHPNELKALYESLKQQEDLNYTWIIIDDGSEEETRKLVDDIVNEKIIDVICHHQNNGGKSKAINKGIELLKNDTSFFVIIDDDEKLYPDAITIIKRFYFQYKDSDCGVIHFNRKDEKGNVIAHPVFDKDFFMSYQQHKSKGLHADGYLGYFSKKLGDYTFNIYDGEKYIAPSTLFMKVTRGNKLLWANAVLGETEYLEGGLTKQGRRLRIKNPRGMIEYCSLMQENGAGLKTRLLYSIQGFAYSSLLKKIEATETSKLIKLMRVPGLVLGYYWRRKYLDQ